MDEIELVYSKHCQSVTRNDQTVKVEIYSSGRMIGFSKSSMKTTIPQPVDDPFDTDNEAFPEFQCTLKEEGIESMVGHTH